MSETTPAPGGEIAIPLPGRGAAAAFRVGINMATRAELLGSLEAHLAQGDGFAVATLNLDHVVKLREDAAFRQAYAAHSHVVADGNPIVWMLKLSGGQAELVPGSELVVPVAEMAARLGVPLGLFGSDAETLEQVAARLEAMAPGLRVSDRIAPPPGFDPEGVAADAYIEGFGQAEARLWLLALGAPKQEVFAARALAAQPGLGFLSVGAGLDFIAGTQVRAPKWVRMVAAEWIWRMAHSPQRLVPRYARCIAVLPGLSRAAWRSRSDGARG